MQTTEGAIKAKETIIRKYGADHWKKIGAVGGSISKTGGFAAQVICNKKLCRFRWGHGQHLIRQCAGARGGRRSRRGPAKDQS